MVQWIQWRHCFPHCTDWLRQTKVETKRGKLCVFCSRPVREDWRVLQCLTDLYAVITVIIADRLVWFHYLYAAIAVIIAELKSFQAL